MFYEDKSMDTMTWRHLFRRNRNTNKYDYGHVLVLGGSQTMVGAPVLTARAALRTGAGVATITSTADVIKLIDRDIEEVMTLSLPSWNENETLLDTIKSFIKNRHVSVLIIGPGLSKDADEVIRMLLVDVNCPLILDAEAFTALHSHLSALQKAGNVNENIVLTPHAGEYHRLVDGKAQYNIDDSQDSAVEFARDYNVTLVMKGHPTYVIGKEKKYRNTTGNPGLATAGAGDVLSGIIAGIVAQGIEPYTASKMAVYLHGLAGDIAATSKTKPGMIASDIIEFLPEALKVKDTFD